MIRSVPFRVFLLSLVVVTLSWGLRPLAANRFIRGDSNVDESVDISDAVNIILYLFAGLPAPRCSDAADANAPTQADDNAPAGGP